MFKPFGNITCLTISWDEEKNHHKVARQRLSLSFYIWLNQGFAFIEYDCAEAAALALHHLKGASINGRRIKLGRPQAALRYQYIFAQIEMEGRATAQVYATNIAPLTDPNKVRKLIYRIVYFVNACLMHLLSITASLVVRWLPLWLSLDWFEVCVCAMTNHIMLSLTLLTQRNKQ